MHTFSIPLSAGNNPETGAPVLGFVHSDMFIMYPRENLNCSEFVDPLVAYGLTPTDVTESERLNTALTAAIAATSGLTGDDALNAGCLIIQEALGITTGDFAGVHFSGHDHSLDIGNTLRDYMLAEIKWADWHN